MRLKCYILTLFTLLLIVVPAGAKPKAWVVITDPGEALYSLFGHACLHMQDTTLGFDYYYSYESEKVGGAVWRYLDGSCRMGLMMFTPEEFLSSYRDEGRGVYEYELGLTATQAGRLWNELDIENERMRNTQYNYLKHGCAHSVVTTLKRALGNTSIQYGAWDAAITTGSIRSLAIRSVERAHDEGLLSTMAATWRLAAMQLIAGAEVDAVKVPAEKKIAMPGDLVQAWQAATIEGRALLSQEPLVTVVRTEKTFRVCPLTPDVVAWVLLALSIAGAAAAWCNYPTKWIDYTVLVAVTLPGILLSYLLTVSHLPNTEWNWLIVPMNILPAIVWHWRRYWAMPWAVVLVVWLVVMATRPVAIAASYHMVLTAAWILTLVKTYVFEKKIKNNNI